MNNSVNLVANAPAVSVDVVTGQPVVVVPVKVNVEVSDAHTAGATGNANIPSILNPDAPTASSTVDVNPVAQARVEDTPVIRTAQSVVAEQNVAVTANAETDATTVQVVEVSTAAAETATVEAATPSGTVAVETSTILLTFTVPTLPSASGSVLGEWQKGATYNVGDEVTWGGETYRALQRHTADAFNWTPAQVQALWLKI